MKIKAKTKDCHLTVRVRLSFNESLDQGELDVLNKIYSRGFLKPAKIKRKLVDYTGPTGISLYDHLKTPISGRDFLLIVEQIVIMTQKAEKHGLHLSKLIFDLKNVYINEVTKELLFIYIPTTARMPRISLGEFVDSISYSVKPVGEKDRAKIADFVHFFRGMDRFNANKIENYISGIDKSVVDTIRKQNAGTSKQIGRYDEIFDNDDEPTEMLSEDEESTALLVTDEESTALLENEDEDGTALLVNDETGFMDSQFPYLVRVLTEEKISINKPVFRIGKEKSYVDYFVTNNNAVSRSHADIITRSKKYFVKDLNSKNRTFINGQTLPVQLEVEIHNGDKLKLGNEEFVFNV